MPRIVRDIQLLVNDDDDHLYGYRLSDGTEVRIGTSRPDNAGAVVGTAIGVTGAAVTPDAVVMAGANFAAIQVAINASREVQIGAQGGGEIYIDKTLIVPSNTKIVMTKGTTLKLAAGKTCHLVRNKHAQNTIPAARFNHSVSGVCTVRETGHSREVGDVVYIHGVGGDATLLGAKTITAVNGEYWSFSASGTGTATGLGYVAPYVPIAGTNFTRGGSAQATCNISGSTMTLTSNPGAVPFVDGMTVTGGTLSGQTIRGPYGIVFGESGETWNLSSSGGTQTGITVTGAQPTNWVRVYEPGHSKLIGDKVFIHGLSGTDSFDGAKEVLMVLPDYWYYETTGTTAESATGTACVLHDNNISLSGDFDGNYTEQTPSFGESHGVVLGNCSKIDLRDVRGMHFFKYSFWLFNTSDVSANGVRFTTRSDGLHFEAPWNRINISDVIGDNEDDVISFTNNTLASTWPDLSSPSGLGDGDNVNIDGVQCLRSKTSSAVKCAGDFSVSSNTVGSFNIENITGSCQYGVYFNSGIVGTGTKGTSVSVANVKLDGPGPNSNPVRFNCGSTGGFLSVTVDGVPVIGDQNNPTVYFQSGVYGSITVRADDVTLPDVDPYMQLDAATVSSLDVTIGNLILPPSVATKAINLNGPTITEMRYSGRITGTGNVGWPIYHNTGTLTRLHVTDVSVGAVNQFYAQASGISAAVDIFVNGMYISGANAAFVTYSATNIFASGVNCAAVNNFFFAPQSTSTCRLVASNDCAFPSAKAIRNASGTVNSVSGFGVKLDIGASGASTPTGLTPLAGDIVWNTNGTGGGAYGRSAAGSWVSIF